MCDMCYYNLEKIKDDLTPFAVIQALNIPFQRNGKHIVIHCPEHEHRLGRPDQRLGNCILGDSFHNAYHCFSCGANGSCLDLIKYTLNLNTFIDVLKVAAEICGNPKDYIVSSDYSRSQITNGTYDNSTEHQLLLPKISSRQLSLLGIAPFSNAFCPGEIISADCIPYDMMEFTDSLYQSYQRDVSYTKDGTSFVPSIAYVKYSSSSLSLSSIMKEEPEVYVEIIKKKATDAMTKYLNLAKKDWKTDLNLKSEKELMFIESLRQYYMSLYYEVEGIFRLFEDSTQSSETQYNSTSKNTTEKIA